MKEQKLHIQSNLLSKIGGANKTNLGVIIQEIAEEAIVNSNTNGIYSGDGIVPHETVASLAGQFTFESDGGLLKFITATQFDLPINNEVIISDNLRVGSFSVDGLISTNVDNQTINNAAGSFQVDSGTTTVVITNSLVTINSLVFLQIMSVDATATIKDVVVGNGEFTVHLTAPTTETKVAFFVVNID